MANYSRQLDKFIKSTRYATSYFRQTDARTYVNYYQDQSGLIHSSTFNYSIIGGLNPVSVEQFKKLVDADSETNVLFI